VSEIITLASANYQFIGLVIGSITAAICVVCSVGFRIQNPESDYLFGLELEATPRLIFMLFLSLWAGVIMAMTWIVMAPVAVVGLAVWLFIRLRDLCIVRRARRSRNA
jgi:hypothetical protein